MTSTFWHHALVFYRVIRNFQQRTSAMCLLWSFTFVKLLRRHSKAFILFYCSCGYFSFVWLSRQTATIILRRNCKVKKRQAQCLSFFYTRLAVLHHSHCSWGISKGNSYVALVRFRSVRQTSTVCRHELTHHGVIRKT